MKTKKNHLKNYKKKRKENILDNDKKRKIYI